MPEKTRELFENAIYHVYSRGNCKKTIFETKNDFEMFLNICNKLSKEKPFKLFSYCLMTNHYHLFIQTPEANLPEIMHHINQRYAAYFNSEHQEIGYVFQGRYGDRVVKDDRDFLALLAYVNLNPYHANMVTNLSDWPWSSYNAFKNKYSKYQVLDIKYPLEILGADHDFCSFIEKNKKHVEKGFEYNLEFILEKILPTLKDQLEDIDQQKILGHEKRLMKVKLLMEKTNLGSKQISKILKIHRSTVDRIKKTIKCAKKTRTGRRIISRGS